MLGSAAAGFEIEAMATPAIAISVSRDEGACRCVVFMMALRSRREHSRHADYEHTLRRLAPSRETRLHVRGQFSSIVDFRERRRALSQAGRCR
jgi:hypothetical protein